MICVCAYILYPSRSSEDQKNFWKSLILPFSRGSIASSLYTTAAMVRMVSSGRTGFYAITADCRYLNNLDYHFKEIDWTVSYCTGNQNGWINIRIVGSRVFTDVGSSILAVNWGTAKGTITTTICHRTDFINQKVTQVKWIINHRSTSATKI